MRCGCLALALYGLSPQMIASAARARPAIVAAMAAFSIVVTAMAVAHTLYAPRAVVLWNGRRIEFLAVALAIGTAASPATLALLPLAAGYLLYLAPLRRPAALAILASAVGLAAILLLLLYSFDVTALGRALTALGAAPSGLASAAGWRMAGRFFYANGAGCALLLAVSLVAWAASPKARWFGNTSMLISALVAIGAALVVPHAAGVEFLASALPFLLLFIAGSARELLDGRWAAPFSGVLGAALLAQAYLCLGGLLELAR